jgi:hypothetical protein
VTQTGDYIFRVCFTDDFQAVVIARFVLEKLKLNKIAFMTDVKQDYSVGLTNIAKDYLTKNGATIVKEQSYSSGDKDFRAQLTDLKAAAPDVIIITGYYPEAALIAKQARQFGIKATLVGGDGWDGSSLIPVGGKAIEGSYFSNHFSVEDTSPLVQTFVQKYKQKYNATPDAFAALGYDAMKPGENPGSHTGHGKFSGSLGKDYDRQRPERAEVCGDHHDQGRRLQVRRDHRTEELRKWSVASSWWLVRLSVSKVRWSSSWALLATPLQRSSCRALNP